jgi:hypothetical protein
VQLIENATRKTTASRKKLNGLTRCVKKNKFINVRYSELDF